MTDLVKDLEQVRGRTEIFSGDKTNLWHCALDVCFSTKTLVHFLSHRLVYIKLMAPARTSLRIRSIMSFVSSYSRGPSDCIFDFFSEWQSTFLRMR